MGPLHPWAITLPLRYLPLPSLTLCSFLAEKSDPSSSSAASKSEASGAGGKLDDVYEFKTGAASKDAPSRTGSPSGSSADQPLPAEKSGKDAQSSSAKDDKKNSAQQQQQPQPQAGDKRGHDNEDDDEARSQSSTFSFHSLAYPTCLKKDVDLLAADLFQ